MRVVCQATVQKRKSEIYMSESKYQKPYESHKRWLRIIYKRFFFLYCHYKLQISKVPQERLRYLISVLAYFPFSNNTPLATYRDNVLLIKLQNHLLDDSIYS